MQTGRRKNAITNGGMDIWQRGTSFAAGGNVPDQLADTWFTNTFSFLGLIEFTATRSTDVPTFLESGIVFNYSLKLDCITAETPITSGAHAILMTNVEGSNWRFLHQRPTVFSFWIKATKIGIYSVSLNNSGTDRGCIKEFEILTSNTWQRVVVAFPASPSDGTWNLTTGIGITVAIVLAANTGAGSARDVWVNTSGYGSSTNQVNGADSTNNNFWITGVQLEPGEIVTEFEQVTFQDELARCMRYYEKTFDYAIAPASSVGSQTGGIITAIASGTGIVTTWHFHVPKRTAPTITTYNPGAAGSGWRNLGDTLTVTETVLVSGENSATIVNNGAATDQSRYQIHATADASL